MCRSVRTRSSISRLARDIGQKFNVDYASAIARLGFGEAFFTLPEPLIQGPATRVMSLKDGTKKMSKSDPAELSRINLTDDAETIARKIRKARTDPEPLPREVAGLKNRAEAENLVGIFAALAGVDRQKGAEFGGGPFSSFKQALADLAVERLSPIAGEMRRLTADPAQIDRILADGAAGPGDRSADFTQRKAYSRVRRGLRLAPTGLN